MPGRSFGVAADASAGAHQHHLHTQDGLFPRLEHSRLYQPVSPFQSFPGMSYQTVESGAPAQGATGLDVATTSTAISPERASSP